MKERAKNNRTLTILPEETEFLKSRLLTEQNIENQNVLNRTLNGDISKC